MLENVSNIGYKPESYVASSALEIQFFFQI
jgi:hypothetical protein